jgi:hypothetical protein
MKDVILSGVFAQTRQSDWRVCKASLRMMRCNSYFENFDLITFIIKNRTILIINLKNML